MKEIKERKSHHREQVSPGRCAGLSRGSVCVRTWRNSQIRSWEYWPNITSEWDVHLARTQEPASKSGNWKRHGWQSNTLCWNQWCHAIYKRCSAGYDACIRSLAFYILTLIQIYFYFFIVVSFRISRLYIFIFFKLYNFWFTFVFDKMEYVFSILYSEWFVGEFFL